MESPPHADAARMPADRTLVDLRNLPVSAAGEGLSARARLGLTLIAGGAVANIYYNQPLLGLLVAEFGDRAALWIPTACLVGYGLGILGLVPLGDSLPR